MITQKYLRENIRYDPDSGLVYWIKSKQHRDLCKPAGTIDARGYRCVAINGKKYKIARLIWLYLYGYLPKEIDHINRIKEDNRLINLREVSHIENSRNRSKPSNNTSQITGVYWHKRDRQWTVSISDNQKKLKFLGLYQDFVEACYTRWIAENLYQYHETHGR